MSDDLLVRLQAAESKEARDWLVTEALLESLPAELQHAAWAAAVPHWFDAEILAALLEREPEQCAALYAELQGLPFVEPFQAREGHNVHEVTRTSMLARLWGERRDEYVALSARAAACFAGAEGAETRIEEIYHQLLADPDAGTKALWKQGWAWHDPPTFAYDRVYALAGAALEHAEAGRLDGQGVGTANLLGGRIDTVYSRTLEAKDKLETARRVSDPYNELRAHSNQRLGDVYRMLAQYADARDCYQEASSIYAALSDRLGEANCILGLGDVHLRLAEYEVARARYKGARQIYAAIGAHLGEANCIKGLGDVNYMLAEYTEARVWYLGARSVYASVGAHLGEANCIQALGDVHFMLSEYTEAQDCYLESRSIYVAVGARLGEANCVKALGDVHRMLDESAEARDRYLEARRIYVAIGDRLGEASCCQALGDVHLRLAEYAEARDYYLEARDIYAAIGARLGEANCDLGLGDLLRVEGDWQQAKRQFEKALAAYREIEMAYNTGLALRRLGGAAEDGGDRAEAVRCYKEAQEIFARIGVKDAEWVRADLTRVQD